MKRKISVILLAFILLLLGSHGILADPISYTDLWDVSQGTVVTANSALHSASDSQAANMFGDFSDGNLYGEGDNTLFADGLGGGFMHWVEWETASEVLVNSLNLVASHDGEYNPNRAFSTFNLYNWTGTAWDSLYSYDASNPYGGGVTYTQSNQLELHDTFSAVTSQKFRAEFVQFGPGDGPRIHELDGYYEVQTVPAPTAAILGFLGLATASAKLRRRRNA